MRERFRSLAARLRPLLPMMALLAAGFALGALVFGLGSGTPQPPEEADGHAHATEADTVWTCSMHPQIRQPEPGQCPICGMDLIPVTSGDDQGASDPGRIVLSERARALARLRTSPVSRDADASGQVRLLGRVEPSETALKTVTAWTGGRIDRLHVKVTGERVEAGQAIATLYSPEIYAAHQDLIVARRQVERLADSPDAARRAAAAALDAARERLRLLGVPEGSLDRMAARDAPTRSVAIRSPFAGTVIERMATEGAYVSTGTPLYRIADLGTLWVQLDAYESDLARLSVGQPVTVTAEALPGETFDGEITFISPTVDPSRRTAQVRVEVANPDGALRPGLYVEATVNTGAPRDGASPLLVPDTAPLFTGRRAVVYVEVVDGDRTAYEARTVRLGSRMGDFYPVVAGLAEGERVVTRGAFAIDADLQIRGGASMMAAPDDREAGAWDQAIAIPDAEREKLAPVVTAYLALQAALAEDDLEAGRGAAERLVEAAGGVTLTGSEEAAEAWAEVAEDLRAHGRHVGGADDIEAARSGFEAVSGAVARLLRRFGNPTDDELHLAFCPMAFDDKGATWIQTGQTIDNSYFGDAMRTCGELREDVAPGGYLPAPGDGDTPASTPVQGHAH